MAKKSVVARVLCAVVIGGEVREPNALVEVTSGQARDLVDLGAIDPHPDAVAHCRGLGIEVVLCTGEAAVEQEQSAT